MARAPTRHSKFGSISGVKLRSLEKPSSLTILMNVWIWCDLHEKYACTQAQGQGMLPDKQTWHFCGVLKKLVFRYAIRLKKWCLLRIHNMDEFHIYWVSDKTSWIASHSLKNQKRHWKNEKVNSSCDARKNYAFVESAICPSEEVLVIFAMKSHMVRRHFTGEAKVNLAISNIATFESKRREI